MEYINACSNVGDYVIEPFAGSGTTILACEKLERKCIAFEISAEYCNVILNLFIHETGKSVKRIASMDLSA
jgi:DNA modification methylase